MINTFLLKDEMSSRVTSVGERKIPVPNGIQTHDLKPLKSEISISHAENENNSKPSCQYCIRLH